MYSYTCSSLLCLHSLFQGELSCTYGINLHLITPILSNLNSLQRRALVILNAILGLSTIIFSSLNSVSRSRKSISESNTARRHCVLLAHNVTGRGQPQLEQFPRTVFLTSKSPLSRRPAAKSTASGLQLVISTSVPRRIPGRGNSKRTGIS